VARLERTSIEQTSPMTSRRQLLALSLAATLPPSFIRDARAADVPRFACGIASGSPRPDGMVLWTRLTGKDLAERVEVQWEVAHDEAFTKIVARGTEIADGAWAHSVHAEPAGLDADRWYWYRFTALGARSTAGRTRTTPTADAAVDRLRFTIASCQRFDHGHYAAWRHVASQDNDLVLFLGDYIYEYASPPIAPRWHEGGLTRTLDEYRARYAQYKGDPSLQAAHAAAPWITVWDDHEVDNDYAADTSAYGEVDFIARRTAAVQAYWEHMPFPKALRPRGRDMRIHGRTDWGRLARLHALDDRQYRDVQVCPRRGNTGGSNTVPLRDCAELANPKRTLLGGEQERWLTEGWDTQRPWNLLAQQTLMARMSWTAPALASGTYWTDGWDGYAPARKRLLDVVAERRVPGVVVLGGDVHAHYVTDLKADYDDEKSPVIATEFCGTSISSHGMDAARVAAALPFNPHIRYARPDLRGCIGFTLTRGRLDATLYSVDNPRDPASKVSVATKFSVAADRAGAEPA
jgi:alkaline phosphatase D